jgi:hypothetical protein
MSARKLNSTDAFRVEQAKKLLADLAAISWATTTDLDMAKLLGRTSVVVEGLVETIEGVRP